ncbi:MAG: NUDIX hydrolase [Pseudohongiellaceae bacterium]
MEPRAASTVVLVRDSGATDDIETLLLLRNSRLVFEGGAWVFPGGKIEPDDYPGRHGSGGTHDAEFEAARRAAIRETREEAGITVDAGQFIHISHWTTPLGPPRRYATWFFVCPFPDRVPVVVDNDEILDHRWLTPRRALALCETGTIRLPLPTRKTLVTLSAYRDVRSLCRAMRRADIEVYPPDSAFYVPPGVAGPRQTDG